MKALILAMAIMAPIQAEATIYPGEIMHVVDGDTVWVRITLWPVRTFRVVAEVKARLDGVDAPEIQKAKCVEEREKGEAAKSHLEELLGDGSVGVVIESVNSKFGDALISLWHNYRLINDEMKASGHARGYDGGRKAGWCPSRIENPTH